MYVLIDNSLRTIIFPEEMPVLGVKGDKDVHKLLFKMPTTYDSCENLIDFNYYVDYISPNHNVQRYDISEKEVQTFVTGTDDNGNEITEECIIFSWLMGEEVFYTQGIGKISICLQLKDDDDSVLQEFHTAVTELPEVLDNFETLLKDSSENLFIIDNNLRTITVPTTIPILGVESDSSVHRLYFRMPAMIDDISLFEDTFIYINYKNANNVTDRYIVSDAELSEDGSYIFFSWLVGRTAFDKAGIVKFIVCIQKVDSESIPDVIIEQDPNVVIIAEYNTVVTCLPPVLEGLEITDFETTPYYDVITSYLAILDYLMDAYKLIKESIDRGLFETYPISRRYFGNCYTDSFTGEKLVEVTDKTFTHVDGLYLDVWFENYNEVDDFTLGVIIRNEDGSTTIPDPEPDEPDDEPGEDDECNDPDGPPWESDDFVLLLNLEPIQEVNNEDDIALIDDADDEENVEYYPVYYICTDEHDIHRVKSYRWEAHSLVTFRYWDGLWVMEQNFATNYGSQANGRYSNSFGHDGHTELYGNTVIGEYNLKSSYIADDDDAMDDENNDNDPNVRNNDQFAFQIGNGTNEDNLSDAFDVTWNGDTTLAGNLYVGQDVIWNINNGIDEDIDEGNNTMSLNDLADLYFQEVESTIHYDTDTGLPVGSESNPVYVNEDGIVVATSYDFTNYPTTEEMNVAIADALMNLSIDPDSLKKVIEDLVVEIVNNMVTTDGTYNVLGNGNRVFYVDTSTNN